jgi:pectate lyase
VAPESCRSAVWRAVGKGQEKLNSSLSAWNRGRDERAQGGRRKAFIAVGTAVALAAGALVTAQLAGATSEHKSEHKSEHHSGKHQKNSKHDEKSKPSVPNYADTSPAPEPAGGAVSLNGTTQTGSTLEGYAAISGDGQGPTTGGSGGSTVTVTSLSQLETEAARSGPETIKVNGLFSGSGEVTVASDKSIIGVGAHSGLTGIGLSMKHVHNVIIQNMNISKVTAASGAGDAIHAEYSDHIWIDHNDLSSDMNHGKDYYDGLVDMTHASDYVTVSWNKMHDHYKVSLDGHSDKNGSQDTGHLHVTYSHNWFCNVDSRLPSLRFGTGHVYDNYVENADSGIDSREGAQFLIENNVFRNVKTPVMTHGYSKEDGYADLSGNDFGGGTNTITQQGDFTKPPYSYHLDPTSSVISIVTAGAGTGIVG